MYNISPKIKTIDFMATVFSLIQRTITAVSRNRFNSTNTIAASFEWLHLGFFFHIFYFVQKGCGLHDSPTHTNTTNVRLPRQHGMFINWLTTWSVSIMNNAVVVCRYIQIWHFGSSSLLLDDALCSKNW